jgi:hypothetical protein
LGLLLKVCGVGAQLVICVTALVEQFFQKALKALFDPQPPHPPDLIEIGYLKAFCETFDDQ